MVLTPDWEVVGCEFKYSTGIFSFLKKKPSLISLILNTKLEKHDSFSKSPYLISPICPIGTKQN